MQALTSTVARVLFAVPFGIFGLLHLMGGQNMTGMDTSGLVLSSIQNLEASIFHFLAQSRSRTDIVSKPQNLFLDLYITKREKQK